MRRCSMPCVPTTQADWGALGEELYRLGRRRHRHRRPDDFAGVPIGGQGVIWYYNKALFDAGRPRPRGAAHDLGGVRGRGRRAQGGRHHAHRGIGRRLVPGVVGVVVASRPSTSPRRTSSGSAPGRSRSTTRGCSQSLQPVAGDVRQRLVERGLRGQGVHGHGVRVHRRRGGHDPRDHHLDRQLDRLGRPASARTPTACSVLPSATTRPAMASSSTRPSSMASTPRRRTRTRPRRSSRSWPSQEGQEILLTESGQFPNRADIDLAAVTGSPGAQADPGGHRRPRRIGCDPEPVLRQPPRARRSRS